MAAKNEVLEYYRDLGIDPESSRFKKYENAGLLKNIDESYIKEVKQYWQKHCHKDINPLMHIVFMNYAGKKDPRIIPHSIYWNEIIPFFNDQNMNSAYKDKNLYDKLITSYRAVETVLKRSHGLYFNQQNTLVDSTEVLSEMATFKENLIVKPSNTNNGKDIKKLYYKEGLLFLGAETLSLEALEKIYGSNFIVQKVLQQNSIMSEPHPDSVNTLRMVTFRWNNEVRYLLTYARFGAGNAVTDNGGTGGILVGVKENGEFLEQAIDVNFTVYTEHPTTGIQFKDLKPIPNFNQFKNFVKELHKEILHHDFVSWDIVAGVDGQPIFLEANFRGPSWLYQLATQQPIFGDLTEEVLEHIYSVY